MDRTASAAERTYQERGVDEQPRRFHRKSIDPDAALVAELRRTDPRAAETLVGAYGDRVYRLAIGITGNASDAEEVVQDAFSSVLRNIGTFRGDASRGSWMYWSVANAASQNVRRRRHHRDELCLDDVLPPFQEDGRHAGPISDWSARIDDPAAQTKLRVALNAAIEDLPPECRVAIVLRDVEGFSMREVADALKISVANAKSRVHRGRLFLRKRLAIYVGSAEAMPGAVGGSTSGAIHQPLPPLAAQATPGVDRPHRPYQPRESEHSAGEVAVESTTRQLASHEVAVTRRTATQTVGAKTWPTSFP